jgi:hypothetical protein
MKSDLDVAKTLILKADNDLKMARIGFDHDAPLDTVAFHVQQAAREDAESAARIARHRLSPDA